MFSALISIKKYVDVLFSKMVILNKDKVSGIPPHHYIV